MCFRDLATCLNFITQKHFKFDNGCSENICSWFQVALQPTLRSISVHYSATNNISRREPNPQAYLVGAVLFLCQLEVCVFILNFVAIFF